MLELGSNPYAMTLLIRRRFGDQQSSLRLANFLGEAQGRNIREWCSDNGAYGRHNREFTLTEIRDLLTRHRFEIHQAAARNLQQLARRYTWIQWLRPTVWNEHLFVAGRRIA